MRKLSLLAFLVVLLTFISCEVAPPSLTITNPTEGAVIDPTQDLVVTWQLENAPSETTILYKVYLNGELLGETQENSFTIPAEKLYWGESYTLKIEAVIGGTYIPVTVSFSAQPKPKSVKIYAVEFNSGPGVPDTEVKITDIEGNPIATGQTDENGYFEYVSNDLPDFVNIELKKQGHALSKVEGYPVGLEEFKTIPIRKAGLNANPDEESFPIVTVELLDASENAITDGTVADDFKLHISVESQNHVFLIYAKLGSVPGSGYLTSPRKIATDTPEATFDMSISGFSGEVPLYVVVYDMNGNRVEDIIMLNIQHEEEEEEGTTENATPVFVPIPLNKIGFVNLIAYTRDEALEFYGKGDSNLLKNDPIIRNIKAELIERVKAIGEIDLEKAEKTILENFGRSLYTAPENTNLWIEIDFGSYSLFKALGLIGIGVEKPDGYRLYRSFDGVHYTKIADIPETDSGIVYYYNDFSGAIQPNMRVWYAITSYKGDWESEKVYLGSVVPLNKFDVVLANPYDGQSGVSRQPTFEWYPTSEVSTDEGTATYHYTVWIYDFVQSEGDYILPAILEGNTAYVYGWETEGAQNVSVQFTGSASTKPVWLLLTRSGLYLYPSEMLEAGKTYDWGLDYAYAEVYDFDSLAVSISIDYGWGIDPVYMVEPDVHNEFTTGDN